MNAQKYIEKDPVIARIAEKKETAWINPYFLPFEMTDAVCQLVVSTTLRTPERGWTDLPLSSADVFRRRRKPED